MKVYCPSCKGEVSAADIDLAGKLAKCLACNNVFNCEEQLPASLSGIKEKGPVARPKNFIMEQTGDGLIIVRKWFSLTTVGLAFFCLFWNAFMVVWFTIAITQKDFIMAVLGSLHGAVGVLMFYLVIAGFLNKTFIRVTYNALLVSHHPLPWFGQRNIPRQEIRQLYSKEVVCRRGKSGYAYTYTVEAIVANGQKIALVSSLQTKEEALFVEQEIEKYLGITDELVSGEIR